MELIHSKFKFFPGLGRTNKVGKLYADLLFFVITIALPTSFFAFLPTNLFYDIRLLYWLMGMLYGLFYFKYLKKIYRIPGGKFLIILVLFVTFRFVFSLIIDDIPFREVVTIFRTNFHYPITSLGYLLYAASMDNDRINRFLYWLFYTTLFLGIIYIISNITGINFYAVVSKPDSEEFLSLSNNLSALPAFNTILFAVGLIAAFKIKKARYHILWIIPFIVTLLSIVRNQIIVYILIIVLFFTIGSYYYKEIRLTRILKFGLLFIFMVLFTGALFPGHVKKTIDKFGFGQRAKVQLSSYVEQGTYAFRLSLIEESYYRTQLNGKLLFGNGYIRDAEKGTYDFVLGGDTLIAPVLYTEGLFGLFLRIMLIMKFLFIGIRYIRKKDSPYHYYALIFLLIIIPEIINAIQTDLLVKYTNTIFIFYLFILYLYNQQKYAQINFIHSVSNKI